MIIIPYTRCGHLLYSRYVFLLKTSEVSSRRSFKVFATKVMLTSGHRWAQKEFVRRVINGSSTDTCVRWLACRRSMSRRTNSALCSLSPEEDVRCCTKATVSCDDPSDLSGRKRIEMCGSAYCFLALPASGLINGYRMYPSSSSRQHTLDARTSKGTGSHHVLA